MNSYEITKRTLNDECIMIDPGRQLDNNNAHAMVNVISEAQSSGYRFIIVDMSRLEFISSAGVGSILGTLETSRSTGGDIILCNVSSNVLKVLKALDLTDYLTIKENERQATAFCGLSS
jgi:anti-anti-sigma factor